MHFEVLVEDASGAIMLETFLGKILGINGQQHTYRIHPCLTFFVDMVIAIQHCDAAVIIVVDLDDKVCVTFKEELVRILDACDPKPRALFRIAIEEMESWLLGDVDAIKMSYPHAKDRVLESYVQDSICGAWERLADAIYSGGSMKLKAQGYPLIGQAKCDWAKKISPKVNVDTNASKSFQVFRQGLLRLATTPNLE